MASSWQIVFLARHGETEWNIQGRRQGQLDSPLTAKGVTQAHRNAEKMSSQVVDAVFTSPLGRAVATARIISEHIGVPLTVIDELAEVHHGEFAGLTNDDIDTRHPGELLRRASDKYMWVFPGGESYADADRRAAHALERMTTYPSRRPLIVSHEMISSMLQRHLLDLDPLTALVGKHPNDVVYEINPQIHQRSILQPRP